MTKDIWLKYRKIKFLSEEVFILTSEKSSTNGFLHVFPYNLSNSLIIPLTSGSLLALCLVTAKLFNLNKFLLNVSFGKVEASP